MQRNESVQYSSQEKSITETFDLIYKMRLDGLPRYLHMTDYLDADPGAKLPSKKFKDTIFKMHQRRRFLKITKDRDSFLYQNAKEKKDFKSLRNLKEVHRLNQNKLTKWTFSTDAPNYDELIENYNLQKVDQECARIYKWDEKDKKEIGLQTYWERAHKKRRRYCKQKYGDYSYSAQNNAKLKKDAMKFRNITCLEAYFLLIEDASTNSWRTTAMAPIARHKIEKIYSQMPWQDYFFDTETESDS